MTEHPRIESFAAIAPSGSRVLILGSMPGQRSLDESRYYAHPQNQFWPIMGELFGAGPERPYRERLRVLGEHGIALWDVARTCRRELSADATMTDIEANDIEGLVRRRPTIHTVFCNGRKSEQMFRRLVAPGLSAAAPLVRAHYLPSTSPANASVSRAAKLLAWRAVADAVK